MLVKIQFGMLPGARRPGQLKRPFVKASKPKGAGLLLGYARVSKGDEQNNALQTKALKPLVVVVYSRRPRRADDGTDLNFTACSISCARVTPSWSGSSIACPAR